ncbi:MAG: hypothetical protein JXB17_13435 [Bacteroidales bacterium]|nr:hypothetical protein [Bacteroidales bacterium]
MKTLIQIVMLIELTAMFTTLMAQQEKIAVLNIDVQGLDYDKTAMGNLVRLELEKKGIYSVMDKYDINYIMKENEFDASECYGKICMVEAGKILQADKMLTGSVEKIDDKIIMIYRLIDVNKNIIEKADIMEYIDAPEIQRMISVSLNNLLNIPNDKLLVDQLTNVNDPVNSPKSQLKLNGPRMGLSFVGGDLGKILRAPFNEGGFDFSWPVSTVIGYQQEISYLSSGNFQALIEFMPMISGMDQGRFVPSLAFLNGIRSNQSGIEIGFGPIFEITRISKGYYDNNNDWHLETDWEDDENNRDDQGRFIPNPYDITKRLDSRADVPSLNTAWVWAVGKTFKSGYLNIPVNIYFSLKKDGWLVGTSFGFNVSKW